MLTRLNSIFSSNQKFDVSCELDALPHVIDFAFGLSGTLDAVARTQGRLKPAFQILDGFYCLGTSLEGSEFKSDDWTPYPFDYDPDLVAGCVAQWVRKNPDPEHTGTDGTEKLGVRVMCKESAYSLMQAHGVRLRDPWTCIVAVQPYNLAYDK